VDGAAFIRFSDKDVVRPPLVARIIRAYDAADAHKKNPNSSK
jgi:phosphate starvation-inducible PhoH-like protein